tara:strand:- start:3761 stop:4780 length:1020 start_codon:yes stop_codon:yes gene_type:complete
MKDLKDLAIVGATGLVGHTFIRLIEEGFFPNTKIHLVASERSKGKEIEIRGIKHKVQSLKEFDFSSVQLALFSAGASVAKEYAPKALKDNCIVIDNSSCFRYEDEVPLVVPEVNSHILDSSIFKGLVANPNCSTIQMLTAIKPIHDEFEIQKINVTTFQAVSGTGKEAQEELVSQSSSRLSNPEIDLITGVYEKPIAFNVIPHCDEFQENRYTKEEMKMVWETNKILDPAIEINPTCVRVPVLNGHSESVHLTTSKKVDLDTVINLLSQTQGIKVFNGEGSEDYPTALMDADGNNDVMVGRIRKDLWKDNGINLWIVADNLRKGAALNSIQIAKQIFEN